MREKGQFWTPAWLARVMAAWVTQGNSPVLFDPAVGPGTFFSAARQIGYKGTFAGFELHEAVLQEAVKPDLSNADLERIVIGDFISTQISRTYPAIISNPPYIRHHRLSPECKEELRAMAIAALGFALDGRVGLHVFLLNVWRPHEQGRYCCVYGAAGCCRLLK